jgi:hypothetical protein
LTLEGKASTRYDEVVDYDDTDMEMGVFDEEVIYHSDVKETCDSDVEETWHSNVEGTWHSDVEEIWYGKVEGTIHIQVVVLCAMERETPNVLADVQDDFYILEEACTDFCYQSVFFYAFYFGSSLV